MFCARYRRLLVPYMECELDERARARIEAHVLRCPKCAAELELLRSVSGAIRSVGVPAMEPAPDLWARVSARIEQETASPARKPWVRVSQAASACAAAVLVGVIGISLVRTNSPQETGRPVYLNKNAVAVGSRAVAPSGARLPGTVAAPARSNRPRPTVSATAEDGPATALQRRVRAHTSEPLGGAEVDSAVPAPVSWRSDKAERAGGETRAHLAGPRKGEEAAERRSRFDLVAAVPASEEPSVAVYAKASAAPKASDPTDTRKDVRDLAAGNSFTPNSATYRSEAGELRSRVDYSDRVPAEAGGDTGESVVDVLNETEGVHVAALFMYP